MDYRCPQWIVAAAVMAAISGCANQPVTSPTYRAGDVWTFAQGVMVGGPLLVETRGNPYPRDQGPLDETVVAAMREAITWSADPRLTADPAEAATPAMRVIWTFNNAGGTGAAGQCRGQYQGGGPRGDGAISVVVTYCDGEDVLSNVGGRLAESRGLSDPAFAKLIRQATGELFRYGGNDEDGIRSGITIGGDMGSFGMGGGGIGIGRGIGGGRVGVGAGGP